jgi:Helicase conserved C-terminal domain
MFPISWIRTVMCDPTTASWPLAAMTFSPLSVKLKPSRLSSAASFTATRPEQARRFNDPDSGYDVLVASDAIGMGLNLNIQRIIFNSVYKNDGTGIVRLDHSAMKQISGRAGRRNSPFPIGGKFTTMVCPV